MADPRIGVVTPDKFKRKSAKDMLGDNDGDEAMTPKIGVTPAKSKYVSFSEMTPEQKVQYRAGIKSGKEFSVDGIGKYKAAPKTETKSQAETSTSKPKADLSIQKLKPATMKGPAKMESKKPTETKEVAYSAFDKLKTPLKTAGKALGLVRTTKEERKMKKLKS